MKNKKIKWIALILIICVFLAGCNGGASIYSEARLKQIAMKSLYEKYGEKFVVHHAWSRSAEWFYADCSPESDPDIVFEATINKNGDGVEADGYVLEIIGNEITSMLQDDVQEVFEGCYTRECFTNYFKSPPIENLENYSIEENIRMLDFNLVSFQIYVDTEKIKYNQIEQEYKLFSETIQKKITNGIIPNLDVRIYFVDDEMLKECEDYFHQSYNIRNSFDVKLDNTQAIHFYYKDGEISITENEYAEKRKEINTNE